MAMKRYSTLLRSLEMEPHHQMQFSVIPRALLIRSQTLTNIRLRTTKILPGGWGLKSSDCIPCRGVRTIPPHKPMNCVKKKCGPVKNFSASSNDTEGSLILIHFQAGTRFSIWSRTLKLMALVKIIGQRVPQQTSPRRFK